MGIFQSKKPRPPVFADYAIMTKPYICDKHHLNGDIITYNNKVGEPYANHVEMSGFMASSIISYGADVQGTLRIMRHVTYPTLRSYPNLTDSSFNYNFNGITIDLDGDTLEKAIKYEFNGTLKITSHIGALSVVRQIFTAQNAGALCEIITLINNDNSQLAVKIINNDVPFNTNPRHGHKRQIFTVSCDVDLTVTNIAPLQTVVVNVAYMANLVDTQVPQLDLRQELSARMEFINNLDNGLIVQTPDNVVNIMCRYAKIRAAESIYRTKLGLMHSPGGGAYYAALWTNDQCEYVNPLFGYLGYKIGVEQSINCYNLYRKYIRRNKPLITSIISEGDGIWHGAKDRGDSAMYAYGLSRFLLSLGDIEIAKGFLQPLRDTLAFTLSRINKHGVIASDSDELENRFESGKANLSTQGLAYDALISAAYIEQAIGDKQLADTYSNSAELLRKNINKYFRASVEGYDTYRYCEEDKKLRSWICIPLVTDICDCVDSTADALLSDKLLYGDGLLTRSGEKTYWDRSTLYAMRGLFACGKSDECLPLLEKYSHSRLLGEHIPYAVEAFPEGNQAHLSAESGLYVRIFIEGILGYRPINFNAYELRPNLPQKWDSISIKNFTAHGQTVDINVITKGDIYEINIGNKLYIVNKGKSIKIAY